MAVLENFSPSDSYADVLQTLNVALADIRALKAGGTPPTPSGQMTVDGQPVTAGGEPMTTGVY